MDKKDVRAAVYCCIDTQEDVFTQLAERMEKAEERFAPDWKLTGVYVEMPGSRKAYNQMTADAEKGLFDLLINVRRNGISAGAVSSTAGRWSQ